MGKLRLREINLVKVKLANQAFFTISCYFL